MRTYAIGDIHGQLDKLKSVHGLIEADKAEHGGHDAPVVHLGDLVDRGPDVKGVMDYLIAGRAANAPWVFILGNHDRMMRKFLMPEPQPDPLRGDLHWLIAPIGGRKSLDSYGVNTDEDRPIEDIHKEARAKVPTSHLELIDQMQLFYVRSGHFFCHAGVRPGVPLFEQEENDLVWIRRDFLEDQSDHGAVVVHGHSPVPKATHYGNRINVDTGAAYGGPLTAIVIENGQTWCLQDGGRQPIEHETGFMMDPV